MKNKFMRSELLFGSEALKKLSYSRVAVFGLGGVGGYVIEALARGGVGEIDLIDHDKIDVTNINRQILANSSNVGALKVEVAKERLLLINPNIKVNTFCEFFLPSCADKFDFSKYDYVVDAVDTVTAKLLLAEKCAEVNIPLISIMGTGNKLEATMLEVADIFDTTICPLARIMRKELKARGIKNLKVVYSKEEPKPSSVVDENGKPIVASNSFVPATAGLIAAGEVIKDLININQKSR